MSDLSLEPIIRPEPKASNGWNGGDIDTARQLFNDAVWDGNLCSKSSRDHLVRNGYAVRSDGYQMLTNKGREAFLEWELQHSNVRP